MFDFLFADDNVYFESPEFSKIEKVVNRELKKVRKWLEARGNPFWPVKFGKLFYAN